jgi:hypothetical protein
VRKVVVPAVVGGSVVDTFASANRNVSLVKLGFNYFDRGRKLNCASEERLLVSEL